MRGCPTEKYSRIVFSHVDRDMYRAGESHKKRDVKIALKVKGGFYVQSFNTKVDYANVVQAKTDDIVRLIQTTLVVDAALNIQGFDASAASVNSKFGAMVGKVMSTVSGPKKILGIVKDNKNTARVVV